MNIPAPQSYRNTLANPLRFTADPVFARLGTRTRIATLDRTTASDIGVCLLRATGSDSSWANYAWPDIELHVEDGAARFVIQGHKVGLSDLDAIDLAKRLIVWGWCA